MWAMLYIDCKQVRFQVGCAKDSQLLFNFELLIDIMKIGNQNLLQVLDLGTQFSAVELFEQVNLEHLWNDPSISGF